MLMLSLAVALISYSALLLHGQVAASLPKPPISTRAVAPGIRQAAARLDYSTYLGGNSADEARCLAMDAAGNLYIAGSTISTNFPVANAVQAAFNGPASIEDIFITKLSASTGAVVYSTYLGGHGSDHALGISVDALGNAYVTGRTTSTDFPVTTDAYQKTASGEDAFVVKLNAGGTVAYATLLGGSGAERGNAITLDSAGNAYVTGKTTSPDFPTTPVALQTTLRGFQDAFVTKLNANGSALLYSTFLGGGSDFDEAYGIAVSAAGEAYVAGGTASADFPTASAFQPSFGGGTVFFGDGFITKLNATGGAVVYSTYLGGTQGDQTNAIAVDAVGNAYITGVTASTNFPTRNAAQSAKAGDCTDIFSNCNDAFAVRLDAAGGLSYSTYLGGGSRSSTANGAGDAGVSVAVDAAGNAYVTGTTGSDDFPTVRAVQNTRAGNGDAFITKLSAVGAVVYSTYFGGVGDESAHAIAVTPAGVAAVAGIATSAGLPTTPAAFQATFGGSHETFSQARDGFVARLLDDAATPSQLRITGASVSGKKLFVTGENFAPGARLFVNGDRQKKTANDETNPTTLLIGRKAGKWVPIGQPVTLQVINPDGVESPPFIFTRQN